MSTLFRTLLRLHPPTPTLLRTLSTTTRGSPPQQPAAINRALRNISRHTAKRRLAIHQQKRFSSTQPLPQKPNSITPDPPLSLSARLRKLSREYGWSAFGLYFALSALDFPFCFMAVRYIGADKIGHYEHMVVSHIKGLIPESVKQVWRETKEAVLEGLVIGNQTRAREEREEGGRQGQGQTEVYGVPADSGNAVAIVTGASATGDFGKGVKEAEEMNASENASIWTQLALAYAIHKSFIFVRVPLTVAVTPRVVKVLRGWGWDIGKRRPKEVREASKKARQAVKEARGGGGGGGGGS